MTHFIERHRERFGVEPICRALQVAPASYYAAMQRPLSARRVRDEALKVKLRHVHGEHFGVYGVRKLWRQLQRENIPVARCTVARLMRELGLTGVVRGKVKRTTVSDASAPRPADLVDRNFHVPAPNRLWVADLTYVRTWSGFAYVAFIVDAYSRRIVGWQIARSLRAELALDALEQALWTRQEPLDGLIHQKEVVLHRALHRQIGDQSDHTDLEDSLDQIDQCPLRDQSLCSPNRVHFAELRDQRLECEDQSHLGIVGGQSGKEHRN